MSSNRILNAPKASDPAGWHPPFTDASINGPKAPAELPAPFTTALKNAQAPPQEDEGQNRRRPRRFEASLLTTRAVPGQTPPLVDWQGHLPPPVLNGVSDV